MKTLKDIKHSFPMIGEYLEQELGDLAKVAAAQKKDIKELQKDVKSLKGVKK